MHANRSAATWADVLERALLRLPDARGWFDRWFGNRGAQAAIFLLFAFIIRAAAFRDPNYHVDEGFYFLVGQRMHEGALPYVDIWDRKPPGIFLTYYLIAGISYSVVAFHVAATLFAAATAFAICRIARQFAGSQGAVLAGLVYLALLNKFGGGGGQTPVFYNLFVATAVWAVLSRLDLLKAGRIDVRIFLAMGLAGLAIFFKQTAFFESVFLGLAVLWLLARSGLELRRIVAYGVLFASVGAAPMVLAGLYYLAEGHFAEFYHAMVTSNLNRGYDFTDRLVRFFSLLGQIGLPLGFACLGFVFGPREPGPRNAMRLVAIWAAVAMVGVQIFPILYDHYMLPSLPAICAVAARFFDRRDLGLICAVPLIGVMLAAGGNFELSKRERSRNAMENISRYITAKTPHGRLFLYAEPTYLYAMTGTRLTSPLVFAHHLFDARENGSSIYDPATEMQKILSAAPESVVVAVQFHVPQINRVTTDMVYAYVTSECRSRRRFETFNMYEVQLVDVYTGCGVV